MIGYANIDLSLWFPPISRPAGVPDRRRGRALKSAVKKGNYISLSAVVHLQCSEDVIEIYERVSIIEGIISL